MIFVDSSAWFAAVNRRDRHHDRSVELLASHSPLATSHLVIVETWLLINSRIDFATAELFLRGVSSGGCEIVPVSAVIGCKHPP
jgi:predicted nucleic acid-binding protein